MLSRSSFLLVHCTIFFLSHRLLSHMIIIETMVSGGGRINLVAMTNANLRADKNGILNSIWKKKYYMHRHHWRIISCFLVGYREISVKIFFDLTLVPHQWKHRYDVIYLTCLALDVILWCVAMRKGYATGNNGKELYWILIKFLPERVKSMK